MSQFAIIGGTGLSDLVGLEGIEKQTLETPYGPLSSPVETGMLGAKRVRFLSRHGKPHHIPPHKINYRANLYALQELGVEKVIAVNAVGSLRKSLKPKQIVIPHQIIDYTYGREHTFSDGSEGSELQHIDFTNPYDDDMRFALVNAAEKCNLPVSNTGVYGCTQGPRLETAAEVVKLQNDGCDVVGMTGMPEAALARELGMDYASICLVVNLAAGLTDEPISMQDIRHVLSKGMDNVLKLLKAVLSQLV